MKDFFEKNKIPVAIVIAALIIAAAIRLSVRPCPSVPPIYEATKIISPPPILPASVLISYTQAPDYIGQYVCVRGIVDNIETSRAGVVFLNFCINSKKCPFGAVILKTDVPKFVTPSLFIGKTVRITGTITSYQGFVKIILTDPAQIEIVQ